MLKDSAAEAQDLQQQFPNPLNRGNLHSLPGGVDVWNIGTKGHAVQPRYFFGENAAFQSPVGDFDAGGASGLLLIDCRQQVPQGRLRLVFPCGRIAPDLYGTCLLYTSRCV